MARDVSQVVDCKCEDPDEVECWGILWEYQVFLLIQNNVIVFNTEQDKDWDFGV